MPKKKSKEDKIKALFENERTQKNLKLFALFLLGFLVGVMLKSQASGTIVSGFDDYRALNSDKIYSTELPLEATIENEELEG